MSPHFIGVVVMVRCLISLGSNLGDRAGTLHQALAEMAMLAHVRLLARSRWHETIPIGGPSGQRAFLNGALLLETRLPACQLLERLLEIESRLGRQRGVASSHGEGSKEEDGINAGRWSPRTIDLDLLLHGVECRESSMLQLPHPRMSYRRFVLEPAVEIAGWMPHPTSGSVLARLLWHLNEAQDYVDIMAIGPQDSARQAAQWLTRELALTLGCRWWKYEGPVELCQFPGGTLAGGLWPCARVQPCPEAGGIQSEKPNIQSLRCAGPAGLGLTGPGKGEPGADAQGGRKSLLARPKLMIAWEKRAIRDRMTETVGLTLGEGPFYGMPGENARVQKVRARGPMACILTTDPRQALAEALAAVQATWPDTIPQA